ncbi:MAG: hypothetical protein K8R64_08005 [Methanosarcinaceae archaeon]|nr:hypothetical protein [Methanosarcinaceae archaeon]
MTYNLGIDAGGTYTNLSADEANYVIGKICYVFFAPSSDVKHMAGLRIPTFMLNL